MPDEVKVDNKAFKVDEICQVSEVRKAFRKALEAQEYKVGNRSVRRADLDKLWAILKAAEDQADKGNWDKYSKRSARQVLMVD